MPVKTSSMSKRQNEDDVCRVSGEAIEHIITVHIIHNPRPPRTGEARQIWKVDFKVMSVHLDIVPSLTIQKTRKIAIVHTTELQHLNVKVTHWGRCVLHELRGNETLRDEQSEKFILNTMSAHRLAHDIVVIVVNIKAIDYSCKIPLFTHICLLELRGNGTQHAVLWRGEMMDDDAKLDPPLEDVFSENACTYSQPRFLLKLRQQNRTFVSCDEVMIGWNRMCKHGLVSFPVDWNLRLEHSSSEQESLRRLNSKRRLLRRSCVTKLVKG